MDNNYCDYNHGRYLTFNHHHHSTHLPVCIQQTFINFYRISITVGSRDFKMVSTFLIKMDNRWTDTWNLEPSILEYTVCFSSLFDRSFKNDVDLMNNTYYMYRVCNECMFQSLLWLCIEKKNPFWFFFEIEWQFSM